MREDENDWRIEDIQRDLAPAFRLFGYAKPRLATLRGHEVVECYDVEEWAKMLENSDRIVEQTTVNSYRISTVFLGLNHSYYREGPSQWFESMIFEEVEGGKVKSDRFCCRYSTWEEAEAGHEVMVEIIRYGNF